MRDGGEDGYLALDHVLLALALGLVDDLGGKLSAGLSVVAEPHHSKVSVTNNLTQGKKGKNRDGRNNTGENLSFEFFKNDFNTKFWVVN